MAAHPVLASVEQEEIHPDVQLLMTLGIPPVGPDRVILRLDHATALDSQLERATCRWDS
jgi:hypothetical protein